MVTYQYKRMRTWVTSGKSISDYQQGEEKAETPKMTEKMV